MIQTFFNAAKFKDTSGNKTGKPLSCASCGLYRNLLHPKIKPYGKFEKGIMIIGQSPGEEEDRKGKPWQGKAGKRKQDSLASLGIDLFRDCVSLNATNCRPVDEDGTNRKPTDYEIACCRKRVLKAIEQYKPKLIILAGGEAVKSVIGHRWKKNLGGITKWRGWTIPDQDFKTWLCPALHPSYVNRMAEKMPAIITIYLQDLKRALDCLDAPFPENKKSQINIIKDEKELSHILNFTRRTTDLLSIDFETTGLKPHAIGHRLVCMSIAPSPNHCNVFMLPKSREVKDKIRKLFIAPHIGKMAHNMVFEHIWAEVRLRTIIKNWKWDSLQAAHILDNRPGITGLKFQTYVNFGVCDYDSHIAPYLEGVEKNNANAVNRIFEFIKKYGEDEVLTYCGYDTLWQYKLALLQMEQMGFNSYAETLNF